MERDELREYVKTELLKLPREASVAFAARAALRVLPVLALQRGTRPAFWFWPEQDRAKNLLAVFGACSAGLAVALGESGLGEAMLFWRRRARAAAAAYSAVADAYADAYAYADAAAYAAAAAADADADAAYAAAAAAAAAAYAYAYAAYAYAAYAAARHYIITQLKNDLKILSEPGVSIKKFLTLPLWSNSLPEPLAAAFKNLTTAAIALDPGFSYWLDFYQARLVGKPFNIAILRKAALIQDSQFEAGAAQVNAYLLNVLNQTASAPLNRVRAIFIGYGEAGKTSLINVLHNRPVQPQEPQTAGVDIHEWPIPNTEIKAHLWDFGGQVMVHATHQLFLRESCLYVLVISARSEINATEQAEYWLEHVKSFGGSSAVLIVGNRADQADLNIDMGVLKQKYPNIIKYFPLSCANATSSHKSHFDAFHAEFCQQLQTLSTHQMLFTEPQFKVLQALRARTPKTSFLSKDEFDQLCEAHQVGTEEVQNRAWLLDILDKLGVIINFKQLPFVDGYVLNPRWLTYGVYTLMYEKKSQLTETDIINLLSKAKISDEAGNELRYSVRHCDLIMTAMREFKLCYSLPEQPKTLIIPALLSGNQPDISSYKTNALAFELAFPAFLPRHIMSELIVTRHPEIVANNGKQLVWQYGVVLQKPHAQALLLVDYHTRKLQIWVSGSAARDYLTVLRDALQVILGRLTIDYEELLVLPDSARMRGADARGLRGARGPELAPYVQVLAHANAGKTEFIATSGAVYDVGKVLQCFVSDERRKREIHNHFYGSGHTIAEAAEVHNQTTTITGSNVQGDVTTSGIIRNSLNKLSKSKLGKWFGWR